MGGAVGLGLCFFGENYQYLKTLFFSMLQFRRKVIQLGSKPVYRVITGQGLPFTLTPVQKG
jgi:hypothetical protein